MLSIKSQSRSIPRPGSFGKCAKPSSTLIDVFNKVGKDPIRYYMISTRNETAIDFDLDEVILGHGMLCLVLHGISVIIQFLLNVKCRRSSSG